MLIEGRHEATPTAAAATRGRLDLLSGRSGQTPVHQRSLAGSVVRRGDHRSQARSAPSPQHPNMLMRAASGSQVHVAHAHDGRKLAVKVQHAGLRESSAADIATVELLVQAVRWVAAVTAAAAAVAAIVSGQLAPLAEAMHLAFTLCLGSTANVENDH